MQHSVGRVRKRSTFDEGEDVIIYDIKSKLSSKGSIIEVLGNNTYLADCGKGPQHVSGDVISRVADVATRTVGVPKQTAEVEDTMDQEDSVSVVSDSSTDTEAEQDDVMAPRVMVPRRRRRVRDNQLGPIQNQRLRPRR